MDNDFLNSCPEPTLGFCPRHGLHPLYRWVISEGADGSHLVTGACLVATEFGPCGKPPSAWSVQGDVTCLYVVCSLRAWPGCLVNVGRVTVDMGIDEDGNERTPLIIRAACDVAQAEAKELVPA